MSRQKESCNLYPPLTVANVYLEKSFCVKYLGVYIDCHLTWHDHIDYTCGKISKNINIMAKLKHHVSKATLIIINIINSKILCTIVYLKFENQRKNIQTVRINNLINQFIVPFYILFHNICGFSLYVLLHFITNLLALIFFQHNLVKEVMGNTLDNDHV